MKNIKRLIVLFQICMLISGITAFFIPPGMKWMMQHSFLSFLEVDDWLMHVASGIEYIDKHYSFFWYGTDWLAFAHILFALLFVGACKDPVRNIWLFQFGIIASLLIIPTALIMGYLRQIPLIWQFIDCSFGLMAAPLLWFIQQRIKNLPQHQESSPIK